MQAHVLDVNICKLFPGGACGGPAMIKEVMGVMPKLAVLADVIIANEEDVQKNFDIG